MRAVGGGEGSSTLAEPGRATQDRPASVDAGRSIATRAGRADVRLLPEADALAVQVADDGVGISSDRTAGVAQLSLR